VKNLCYKKCAIGSEGELFRAVASLWRGNGVKAGRAHDCLHPFWDRPVSRSSRASDEVFRRRPPRARKPLNVVAAWIGTKPIKRGATLSARGNDVRQGKTVAGCAPAIIERRELKFPPAFGQLNSVKRWDFFHGSAECCNFVMRVFLMSGFRRSLTYAGHRLPTAVFARHRRLW